ncbi:MAG: hypothetical protein ABI584_06685 [Acidobacteriota bacterium]
MKDMTRVNFVLALGAAAALAACASSPMTGKIVAQATELPDHFMVTESGLSRMDEPKAGEGCKNPMADPRKGTILNLMRSKGEVGDYQLLGEDDFEIQARYGVDSTHYLRIDCATGKALGIVAQ